MNDPGEENYKRFIAEDWAQRKLETEELVASSASAVNSSSKSTQSSAALLAEMYNTLCTASSSQSVDKAKPKREFALKIDHSSYPRKTRDHKLQL